jgi:hypothetical protein
MLIATSQLKLITTFISILSNRRRPPSRARMIQTQRKRRPPATKSFAPGSLPRSSHISDPRLLKLTSSVRSQISTFQSVSLDSYFLMRRTILVRGLAYAVFDILMDKPMFDYIAKHRLYSVQGQDEFAGPIIFPSGSNPTKDKDAS